MQAKTDSPEEIASGQGKKKKKETRYRVGIVPQQNKKPKMTRIITRVDERLQ